MIVAMALAWAVILVAGWLGWQLLRQNGRLLLRLDELEKRLDESEFADLAPPAGLPLESSAPDFDLPDLTGQRHTLVRYRGQSVLLIFFNSACGFCRELAPKLKEEAENRKQKLETGAGGRSERPLVLVISTGEAEANRKLFIEHQVSAPVLLQKQSEVAAAYGANGTPSGYLISAKGEIASELAIGAEALLDLLAGKSAIENSNSQVAVTGNGRADRFRERPLARSRIKRDGLKAGTPAPEFCLPRLDGRGELSLSELRGRQVLLVFSSPDCGPCNTLAPQLEKFHRGHPELELVMISKGEPADNRAKVKEHGLTFPVVLQQQWEISRRYAIFATPIAYLLESLMTLQRARSQFCRC